MKHTEISPINMKIGNNLEIIRTNNGIGSQTKMANELNKINPDLKLNQSKITRYETGKVSPPAEVLLAYSQYFNMSIDEIIDNEPFKRKTEQKIKKEITFSDIIKACEFIFNIYPLNDIVFTYKKDNFGGKELTYNECKLIFKDSTPLISYLEKRMAMIEANKTFNNEEINIFELWANDTFNKSKHYDLDGFFISKPLDFEDEISNEQPIEIDFLEKYTQDVNPFN